MNKIKNRNSNIELLRIITIFMIITYHFAYYNNGYFDVQSFSINKEITNLFLMCGKLGSNIFVIISGYFLTNSKKINITKTIKIIIQMTFYSILFYIFLGNEFNIITFIKYSFPYIFNVWWFASVYLIIYIFHPYINNFIQSLDKKKLLNFIILLTVLWSVIPTFTGNFMYSNELLWFFLLYIISAYIKLYVNLDKIQKNKLYIITTITILLTYLSSVVLDFIGLKYYIAATKSIHFFSMQSITILILSILIFLVFAKISLKNNYLINKISKCTFGIYLIHDNYFIRTILWKEIFKPNKLLFFNNYIISSILTVVIVFIGCLFIEYLRLKIFSKIEDKIILIIENKGEKIWKKTKKFSKKLIEQ